MWTSTSPIAAGYKLIQLPLAVLDALGSNERDTARTLSSLPFTPYIFTDECARVWRMRAAQIRKFPEDATWTTRLLIAGDGTVVGRAGFHGRPDGERMVEVGYSVDPLRRRQGHARAAMTIMMDIASAHSGVTKVRASVAPGNVASTTLVQKFGFREVGEQWDDEDGLEIILEVCCKSETLGPNASK